VARYCWWGIALILSGCSAQAVSQSLPTPSATVPVSPESVDTAPQRRFQIKLTLAALDDLKVKEGATVIPGQILADRVRDQTRLAFQQRELQQRIKRLKAQMALPVPEVSGLPTASVLGEVADVERLKLKAKAVQQAKEQQQRKLDLIQSLPKNEVPEATVPHEQAVLEQKQREVDQALAEVELSRGKLAKAQSDRQFQEYQHSLEMSKRAIALRQQEIQQQGELAQVEGQLSQVETQLSTLSAVRSPYAGKISRLKFQGQTDQSLAVELVLVVTDDSSRPSAIQVTPSPTVSPSSNPADGGRTP
jgi:chromosome segregation ATPase